MYTDLMIDIETLGKEPGCVVQLQRQFVPGFGAVIGDAGGVDQDGTPPRGGPAPDLNRFEAVDEKGRPELFQ